MLPFLIGLALGVALPLLLVRSSGCESGIFSRGMAVDTEHLGDGIGRFASRNSPCYLVPKLPRDSWPSDALALCPGSSHPGSGALGYLLRLNLGQRG